MAQNTLIECRNQNLGKNIFSNEGVLLFKIMLNSPRKINNNFDIMIILLLLFILPATIISQSNLDSLSKAISKLPDTTQIRLLTDFCWQNRSKNPYEALKSAEKAIKISDKIDNKKLKAKALNLMGVVYRNLGNYDKSLSMYNSALKNAEEAKDSVQIAYSYNNLGGIYRLEGNNVLALEYILKALKIFERLNLKSGISFCTINIGLIYTNQENYLKALEYLNYTLRIRNEINDRAGRALTLNLIAEVYYKMHEITVALKYYLEAEKEYRALDDKKGLAAVWGGIGRIYFDQNNLQKALEYRKRALDLSYKISYSEGEVTNHNNLALIYAKLDKIKEAEDNLKKAQAIASNLKTAYLELECYKFWSDYYELRGNYKKALFYNKKYITLKDSIASKENLALISSMEAAYKAEKIEKENAILHIDNELNKKQRNYLLVIAFLIIVIAGFIYSRYRAKRIASDKYKELNAVKDKFFKIIAHDLKAPFNTILGSVDILKNNYHELTDEERFSLLNNIASTADKSYQLLDNLLVWSQSQTGKIKFNPSKINLSHLFKETASLFEHAAKNKNLELVIDCPENLEVYADEQMLHTVMRNLISNGIKFTEKGQITIKAYKEDGSLKVIVNDTGIGMDEAFYKNLFKVDHYVSTYGTHGEKGTGLGLILCKEFIEKHNGKIWVESKLGEGSKFIFTIPLITNSKK
ncbi:tetratricopeptide repeat protein [Melioribacteraceae bacterium 4301-Me]|uniref:tetratricopeptide repeat-containing sensor histidine kinase n=1 Tax=Pyranulibacter aquaticus TaxID=3163344 RepID=UPI003599E597